MLDCIGGVTLIVEDVLSLSSISVSSVATENASTGFMVVSTTSSPEPSELVSVSLSSGKPLELSISM